MLIRRTPRTCGQVPSKYGHRRHIHHQVPRQAALAAAIAPAPTPEQIQEQLPIQRYDPLVPPSHKAPDLRKSQLLRQYTSLIRSTPLTIFFQHNSLKADEWAAIRRELSTALHNTSATLTPAAPDTPDPADSIRLQVIQTGMFAVALRIAEFYSPPSEPSTSPQEHQEDSTQPIHALQQNTIIPTHALSTEAHAATLDPSAVEFRKQRPSAFTLNPRAHKKRNTSIHALLCGPVAALTFPTVTPQHLAAALCILCPTPGATSAFPAPRRAANPRYYEPAVQNGLQKLIMLGARVENRALDREGVKWVAGLAKHGGLEGLRAQLVGLLQQAGGSVASTLESASRNLWVTMESRRLDLDEKAKDGNGK